MGRDRGEKCQILVTGRKAANHTAMCVPKQQSCMFFTCTPKPKMQLKNKKELLSLDENMNGVGITPV